jgi:plasmid stabilization system protein ParE
MKGRYVLAPEAALDLLQIWRYIKEQSSLEIADHVESVILEKVVFLAGNTGAGHWRKNLTEEAVKFFPVYSYLIVYRPDTEPLQVIPSSMDVATLNKSSKTVSESWRVQERDADGYNGPCAPVAQLDRASGFEPEGREFESLRARHFANKESFAEILWRTTPAVLAFSLLLRIH